MTEYTVVIDIQTERSQSEVLRLLADAAQLFGIEDDVTVTSAGVLKDDDGGGEDLLLEVSDATL